MDWTSIGATLHTFWTVWMVAIFVGIIVYAFWPGNRGHFETASRIPLQDDEQEVLGRGR